MVTTLPLEPVTVPSLRARKGSSQKISALTAYDYTFARLIDGAGIEVVLVGDSLGSVIQGHSTTLPVTLDEVVYHSRCVARGITRALLIGDLPFLSYQASIEQAILSAGRLLKEGGIQAVKLEGGVPMAPTIARLVELDVPVMGHVGLTPQSVHRMGGFRVQGRERSGEHAGTWERIIKDAQAVEAAGAFALVIEGVPAELAREITEMVAIPTIGIGAGPSCDGQIIVLQDLLGLGLGKAPKFVKEFASLRESVADACERYQNEVRSGAFPGKEHEYSSELKKGGVTRVDTSSRPGAKRRVQ